MPSRAYTSFLQRMCRFSNILELDRVNALSGLYLISTAANDNTDSMYMTCVNALSGLYLISTPLNTHMIMMDRYVSMPSRAYTSFLLYPFKNLGFMRFPEPVFAGIYQNILTTAVFRAC